MLAPDTLLQQRYRIVRPIGSGGMGIVYEAIHEQLQIRVALKHMLGADASLSRGFEREAQILAGLRHPALPSVIDHFSDVHGQFFVMEYISGPDLSALLAQQRAPFAPADVLKWADQLLDVLAYLHTREPQVLHRDIKPRNLKLNEQGDVILLDFGLAKGAPALRPQASADSVSGFTLWYAPLEQIQGAGTDVRSDLYALAATLYHLVTGLPPADAVSRAQATLAGQPDPLKPAHELNALLPREVGDLLTRTLSLYPEGRPRSAAELRALLKEAGLLLAAAGEQTGVGFVAPRAAAVVRPLVAAPSDALAGRADVTTAPPTRDRAITAPPAPDKATTAPRPAPAADRPLVLLATLAVLAVLAAAVFFVMRPAATLGPEEQASGIQNVETATPTPPVLPAATPTASPAPEPTSVEPSQTPEPAGSQLGWQEVVTLTDSNGCGTTRVIPDDFDLSGDIAAARARLTEMLTVDEPNNVPLADDWPLAMSTLGLDESGLAGFHIDAIITGHKDNEAQVVIKNQVPITIMSQDDAPAHQNILTNTGCGGAADLRIFPMIQLDSSVPLFRTLLESASGNEKPGYFTLAPGEPEFFVFNFNCVSPGVYQVSLNMPFVYTDKEGQIALEKRDYTCPAAFTVWTLDPTIPLKTYVWQPGGYVLSEDASSS